MIGESDHKYSGRIRHRKRQNTAKEADTSSKDDSLDDNFDNFNHEFGTWNLLLFLVNTRLTISPLANQKSNYKGQNTQEIDDLLDNSDDDNNCEFQT